MTPIEPKVARVSRRPTLFAVLFWAACAEAGAVAALAVFR